MKYGVCLILAITVYASAQAQEAMTDDQASVAHYVSPALRYSALGNACRPMELVIPAGLDKESVKRLKKNKDWFKEKTAFFLQYKHLKLAEREKIWEKLQADTRLKRQHTALQRWLAQKAQEPVGAEQENSRCLLKSEWHSIAE